MGGLLGLILVIVLANYQFRDKKEVANKKEQEK